MSAPPRSGYTESATVMTAEFCPIRRARSMPSQWSLMITTARLIRPAEPIPCRKRVTSRTSKVGASPPRTAKAPNTTRQGTTTRRRPYRSARKPMAGAMTIPGTVPTAISGPAHASDRPNTSRMSGTDAAISAFARRPVAVSMKTTHSAGRRRARGASPSGPDFPDRVERRRPSNCPLTLASNHTKYTKHTEVSVLHPRNTEANPSRIAGRKHRST